MNKIGKDHSHQSGVEHPISPNPKSGRVQFLIRLLDYWNLDHTETVMMLGFAAEESELVNRILEGKEKLPVRQDIEGRISHLLFIRQSLYGFFQNDETENEWLREPQPLLDGEVPMSLLLNGKYEDLLWVREYVETVTGANIA